MQNLFHEVATLDKRSYDEFHLNEDLLMEHAASGIREYIFKNFELGSSVLIAAGGGNNGADGVALARLLHEDFNVNLYLTSKKLSKMGELQLKRAEAVGVKIANTAKDADVVVDAVFGTGLQKPLQKSTIELLNLLNSMQGFKIACDIPSGINTEGEVEKHSFCADTTLTMGGLKLALYADAAKQYTGEIQVLALGIARNVYERDSSWKLLDKGDLELPHRDNPNSNKGSYGHLAILGGDKEGASLIASKAALYFGTGLVTLVANSKPSSMPLDIMYANALPANTTAICAGMGLGNSFKDEQLSQLLTQNSLPLIVDADLMYSPIITELMTLKQLILTPHPKEFTALLLSLDLADIDTATLQNSRFHYAQLFSEAYPNAVLVLKGANTIIAHNKRYYINPLGTPALSKGGSGDVLAGLMGALLAQNFTPLEAAISGSLAQTIAASNSKKNSYALSPLDIIKEIQYL